MPSCRCRNQREAGVLDDREPIELDQLEKWQIGDALLRGTLSGADTEAAWTRFRAAGVLPLGTPGRTLYETLAAYVDALTRVAVAARGGERLPPEELDLV